MEIEASVAAWPWPLSSIIRKFKSWPTPESKLEQVYESYVQFEIDTMDVNMEISREFVQGFKRHLAERWFIDVKVMEQGSGFDGTRVGTPDEFDFLLVLDLQRRVKPVEAPQHRNQGVEYWRLETADPALVPFCDDGALSTRKYKSMFQAAINRYTSKVRTGKYVVEGVAELCNARIGNPALNVKLLATPTNDIVSVDITICIELQQGWLRTYNLYFIAKHHAIVVSNTDWLITESPQEFRAFSKVSTEVKKHYRTTKFLLQHCVANTYILKTTFLHLYPEFAHTGWWYAARKYLPFIFSWSPYRGFHVEDVEKGGSVKLLQKTIEFLEQRYTERSLVTYHLQSEDLFARYNDEALKNHAGRFRRMAQETAEKLVPKLTERAIRRSNQDRNAVGDAIQEINNKAWQQDLKDFCQAVFINSLSFAIILYVVYVKYHEYKKFVRKESHSTGGHLPREEL